MLNNQRISSFTNLKWANLEMTHPYHHLSVSIFQSAWPQIYPATRQESAKKIWGRLIGSWLEIELVFLWKTSGYLLPNAKVAIEKAGLGSFTCEILWNEENSESKGHVWNPDQHIEFHIIMLIYVYHCLSIFIYLCNMVDVICSVFGNSPQPLFYAFPTSAEMLVIYVFLWYIIYVLLYFNKCVLSYIMCSYVACYSYLLVCNCLYL